MIFNRKWYVLLYFLSKVFMLSTPTMYGQKIINAPSHKISECIIKNAQNLIGKRYQPGTLESDGLETLKCSDDTFDCFTFIEYVLALTYSHKDELEFKIFLTKLRYRDGIIHGYGSRLHYFTEWILQNSALGIVKDVTMEIGGVNYEKNINYMSTHIRKYPRLEDSSDLFLVKDAEMRINSFPWKYIPKKDIKKKQHKIQSGDIIAITTNIAGLDVVHTGFAIKKKGDLFLLHASETAGKVVVSKKNLNEYVQSNTIQSGIIVLRCLGQSNDE